MEGIKDRILGFLYGCAIGDAFGMPAEMWEPDKIKAHYGWIDSFIPSSCDNEISGGFKAGETTDDTIVALISTQMLLQTEGNPEPLEIVKRIEQWALDNPKSKTIIGPSTKKAFDAIKEGKPVSETGITGITNGAGTRVAPVGIICRSDDFKTIAGKALNICMATHNTDIALSGAVAIASAVAHGMEGKPLESLEECVIEAARYGQQFGNRVSSVSMADKIKKSFELSSSVEDDARYISKHHLLFGSGLPMEEACPAALAIAVRCRGDIKRCAVLCANMGGDTDTVAAIACLITGAHTGVSNIPASMVELVKKVNGYDFSETADGLAGLRARILEEK